MTHPQVGSVWKPKGMPEESREVVEVDSTHVVFHVHGGSDYCTLKSWHRWVREKEATCTTTS